MFCSYLCFCSYCWSCSVSCSCFLLQASSKFATLAEELQEAAVSAADNIREQVLLLLLFQIQIAVIFSYLPTFVPTSALSPAPTLSAVGDHQGLCLGGSPARGGHHGAVLFGWGCLPCHGTGSPAAPGRPGLHLLVLSPEEQGLKNPRQRGLQTTPLL